MANLADMYTTTVTNGTFATPEGAGEIFIKNKGQTDISVTGNAVLPSTGLPSTAVTISSGDSYSLGYIGRGRKSIVIDATGSIAEITITF